MDHTCKRITDRTDQIKKTQTETTERIEVQTLEDSFLFGS